jgi:hypothetical protein
VVAINGDLCQPGKAGSVKEDQAIARHCSAQLRQATAHMRQ